MRAASCGRELSLTVRRSAISTFTIIIGGLSAGCALFGGARLPESAPAGSADPQVVYQPVPSYPAAASERGLEGDVLVRLSINPHGFVDSASVIRGPRVFHDAARRAALEMRFTRPVREGRPSRVHALQTIRFRLTDSAGGSPVLPYDEVDTPPVVFQHAVPEYPRVALARRLEGEVWLRMVVGADGRVDSVGVVSGEPILREAAVDAAGLMVFSPGMENDRPVRVRMRYRVPFRLDAADPAPVPLDSVHVRPRLIAGTTALDERVADGTGRVVARLLIGRAGRVLDVEIAAGPESALDAVKSAARSMRYQPARVGAYPVRVWIVEEFTPQGYQPGNP